jgi:hypothetical protein
VATNNVRRFRQKGVGNPMRIIITLGDPITANFIGITEQQAHQVDPRVALDTSKWRGELVFTGDLEPAN